jgi:hypothetical protein
VERSTTYKGGEKVAVYFKMESKTSINAATLKKNTSIMKALKKQLSVSVLPQVTVTSNQ